MVKKKKLERLLILLTNAYFDELDYYNSIDEKFLNKIQRDYQIANQIISNMYDLTTKYNDEVSQKKILELYEKINNKI